MPNSDAARAQFRVGERSGAVTKVVPENVIGRNGSKNELRVETAVNPIP